MKSYILTGVAMMMALSASAEIELPDIFSDNMVLQQQSDAKLWGWSTPMSTITVKPDWSDST